MPSVQAGIYCITLILCIWYNLDTSVYTDFNLDTRVYIDYNLDTSVYIWYILNT